MGGFPGLKCEAWGSQSVGPSRWIRYAAAGRDDGFGGGLAQAFDVVEADAERESAVCFGFGGAGPVGFLDVDGADAEAGALRVFDEDGGGVEAHGLVVEQGAGEGC